jgi:putative heme iron utilization protein
MSEKTKLKQLKKEAIDACEYINRKKREQREQWQKANEEIREEIPKQMGRLVPVKKLEEILENIEEAIEYDTIMKTICSVCPVGDCDECPYDTVCESFNTLEEYKKELEKRITKCKNKEVTSGRTTTTPPN